MSSHQLLVGMSLALGLLLPCEALAQQSKFLLGSQCSKWSPDGQRVVFFSTMAGNPDIWVIDADGSNLEQLTDNIATDIYPSWSPDGKTIAFASGRDGDMFHGPTQFNIYLLNVESGEISALTSKFADTFDATDPGGNHTYPLWSPDRSQIAFLSTRSNGWREIYLMNADGTELRRVTNDGYHHWNPVWHPNGSRIIYEAHPDGVMASGDGHWGLWSINIRGGDRSQISTESPGDDYDCGISPDGTRVIFSIANIKTRAEYDRMGGAGLFIMDIDGSNRGDVAVHKQSAFSPDWSPDGTKITFTSSRDGIREVYVMNADGTDAMRLTFSE